MSKSVLLKFQVNCNQLCVKSELEFVKTISERITYTIIVGVRKQFCYYMKGVQISPDVAQQLSYPFCCFSNVSYLIVKMHLLLLKNLIHASSCNCQNHLIIVFYQLNCLIFHTPTLLFIYYSHCSIFNFFSLLKVFFLIHFMFY